MSLSLEREVWGSNFGPIKLDAVLPAARHSCDISSRGAVLPAGTKIRRWAPQTRYTLRRSTASIIKDLIWLQCLLQAYCTPTIAALLFWKPTYWPESETIMMMIMTIVGFILKLSLEFFKLTIFFTKTFFEGFQLYDGFYRRMKLKQVHFLI